MKASRPADLRWGIIARYSDEDLQDESSIDDQDREVRAHVVARWGGRVVDVYADRGISGSIRARPELTRAVADLKAGRINAIAAEHTDRISRDLEDTAWFFKHVRAARAIVVTVAQGEVDDFRAGIDGTVAAADLHKLALRVRRGQQGALERGFIPNGLGYGYTVVRRLDDNGELVRGLRAIDPHQADVVREIFTRYAAGEGPKAICRDLNRRGEPGPRGGAWSPSTIMGNKARRNGILHNQAYIGVVLWGRLGWSKDPDTRRRTARANDEADWIARAMPELRIVDDALWDAAQRTRRTIARRPLGARTRPKHLFSGLLRCGLCGGTITTITTDRLGCSNQQRGICENGQTIARRIVEARVLAGIRGALLAPELVAAATAAYIAERKRLAAGEADARRRIERKLQEVDRGLRRLVTAIEEGAAAASVAKRLHELEGEKAALEDQLAATPAAPAAPAIVAHPGLAEAYRRMVEDLQAALAVDDVAAVAEARAALRAPIDKLVIYPGAFQGFGRPAEFKVEIVGDLAQMLRLASGQTGEPRHTDVLVAGTRSRHGSGSRAFMISAWA